MFELASLAPSEPVVRIICFASEFKVLPSIVESHYLVIDEVTELMVDWHWIGGINSDEKDAYKASDSVPITAEILYDLLKQTDLTVVLCSYTHPWRKKVIDLLGQYYRKNNELTLFIAAHWSGDQTDHAQTIITSEYEPLSYDGNLVCSSPEDTVIAVRGIAELIMAPSMIGMDFADVRAVLKNKEAFNTAFGCSSGEGRALRAVTSALSQVSVTPQTMLVTINGGLDMELDEFSIVSQAVEGFMTSEASIVAVGVVYHLELEKRNRIEVSLISGFTTSV